MNEIVLQLGTSQTQILTLSGVVPDVTKARIIIDTTEGWRTRTDYVAPVGTIVVYSDRNVIDGKPYPGVKLGDGTTFAIDLPFVGDDIAYQIIGLLTAHEQNTNIHVTPEEKTFWNNKLNYLRDGETLILNRN